MAPVGFQCTGQPPPIERGVLEIEFGAGGQVRHHDALLGREHHPAVGQAYRQILTPAGAGANGAAAGHRDAPHLAVLRNQDSLAEHAGTHGSRRTVEFRENPAREVEAIHGGEARRVIQAHVDLVRGRRRRQRHDGSAEVHLARLLERRDREDDQTAAIG